MGIDRVPRFRLRGSCPHHGFNCPTYGIVVLISGREPRDALMTVFWQFALALHLKSALILRHCRVFEAFPDFIFKTLDLEVSRAFEILREIGDPRIMNPIDLSSSSEHTASAVSERGRSGEASSSSMNYSTVDLEDVTPKGVLPALECRHESKNIASILDGRRVERLWFAYQFLTSGSFEEVWASFRTTLAKLVAYIDGCAALWPAATNREEDLTSEDFFCCYKVTDYEGSGWYYFSVQEGQFAMVSSLLASHKRWKEKFFFVYREGMEISHWEVMNDQIPSRLPVLEDQARTNRVERVRGHPVIDRTTKVPAVSPSTGALAPPITQTLAQTFGQGASILPLTLEVPSQSEQPIEPLIVEDMQAAWKRMLQFISFDDVVPLNDWTNTQLTKSMNHDALKLHVKAMCLSTHLKTKASEGAQKGKVNKSLTKTNEDLEKVAELEEQLKAMQEKDGTSFQEEINEAYLDGFIDAKVAAKSLFPDLDFSALKPADDTVSQAIGGGDQNPIVEEDDAQS
ncbi:hypothetical protein Acr_04g0004340 [Actinidia rufa]|uniref:Uncharacterized protein n=1 Tax=Actinidia rufa TaxID=165716 RepID=A0A7J0EHN6_9ERIC|nr:hypothetical protein Acr_04g0004340 [Actinidia rufa]